MYTPLRKGGKHFHPPDRLWRRWRALGLLSATLSFALSSPFIHAVSAAIPQTQQGGRLTIEQLGDALSSYGKNTVNNNGQVYYSVNVSRGQWKGTVIVSLSPNKNFIWMTIDPAAMPDPGQTSAAAILNLLKKNDDIGPMFFSVNGRRLRLSSPVPNYDLTAATVKAYLQAVVDTTVNTMSLWDPAILRGGTAGPTF
jgi:hypothetical protein